MKKIKKKTAGEFTLVHKIKFTQEEFEKLLATEKSISLPPDAKKVTKNSKSVVIEGDEEEDSDEVNKKNIDPVHKYGGSNN